MSEVIFGASFSLHRCSELGIDKHATLTAAIKDLGIKRFRLMSYWDIHEQKRGEYNFDELDWQLDLIAKNQGQVMLCLGMRQPRWPEFHMPDWARELPKNEWQTALNDYIAVVVNRYKNHPALQAWQLENEALLKSFGFGHQADYDRKRLQREITLVKQLDPNNPVIMTLSDSWGVPWHKPKPDMYAMSMYRITANKHKNIVQSRRPAVFYRLRAWVIRLFKVSKVFNHELQMEPWGLTAITEMPINDQLKQISPEQLKANLKYAIRAGVTPIDLWGLEWWYWLKTKHNKPETWRTVKSIII